MRRGTVRLLVAALAVPAAVLLVGGSRTERQPAGHEAAPSQMLRASLLAAIGARDASFSVTADGRRVVGKAGGLSAVFGASGVAIQAPGGSARLRLVGLGVGG